MSFIEELLKSLSSIFGKKDTEQPVEQVSDDYEIPGAMKNELVMIKQAQKLTDAELADLEHQIKVMGSLGITHYIIHTNGRGEPSKWDHDSGDRYWECMYLKGARTMSIRTQFHGFPKQHFVDKGMEGLFYENLLS